MYSELTYIHRSRQMRTQAIKHLSYIETREGRDGEIMDRPLFGKGGRFTPEQITEMITDAPGNTLFWKFIFNPDPVLENPEKLLDLRQLTGEAVRWLEERLGNQGIPRELPFAASIHDDHTQLAHVHGIVFMERRGRERPITPQILSEFRQAVSEFALTQVADRLLVRTEGMSLANEAMLEQEQGTDATYEASDAPSNSFGKETSTAAGGGASDAWGALSCPSCSVGTLNRRLNSKVYECGVCGYAERYGRVVRSGRRKEAERARSL